MHEHVINERYRIDKAIGRGGMAVVYKAFDLVLKRTVAIKILHKQFANNAHFIERFRREAYSAASLIHHNITTIYDTGYSNGLYYIVMEYVNGKTLKQIIDEGAPLPIQEAVDITRQVANALRQAHSRRIIHRDIKPQNILVTEEGVVKVTDFGIARALMMPGLTQTGKILGTARYISPEQAKGQQADKRSDLYSLGIILHEMLSGKPLFKGNSSVEMAEKHVREKPPNLLDLNSAVPFHLELIVRRLLQKEPEERYQDAGRLLEDLSIWEPDEKRDLIIEDSTNSQEQNLFESRDSRYRNASKNNRLPDSDRKSENSRKRLAKRERKTRIGNRRDVGRKADTGKQKSVRKRLTPFAKSLAVIAITVCTGALFMAVWFGVIAEPGGESETQRIMKRQAELEKMRVAVQGTKVGDLEPKEILDYDPEGGDGENPQQLSRLTDGKLKTGWSTETYRSSAFSGLKDGVGVYFDYGVPENVRELTIDSSSGWSGEIRGSNNLKEWVALHTVENADEKTSFLFDNNATYRYYLLWITKLPPVGKSYRCKIYEIKARGTTE